MEAYSWSISGKRGTNYPTPKKATESITQSSKINKGLTMALSSESTPMPPKAKGGIKGTSLTAKRSHVRDNFEARARSL